MFKKFMKGLWNGIKRAGAFLGGVAMGIIGASLVAGTILCSFLAGATIIGLAWVTGITEAGLKLAGACFEVSGHGFSYAFGSDGNKSKQQATTDAEPLNPSNPLSQSTDPSEDLKSKKPLVHTIAKNNEQLLMPPNVQKNTVAKNDNKMTSSGPLQIIPTTVPINVDANPTTNKESVPLWEKALQNLKNTPAFVKEFPNLNKLKLTFETTPSLSPKVPDKTTAAPNLMGKGR
jgi:hypothetical protein